MILYRDILITKSNKIILIKLEKLDNKKLFLLCLYIYLLDNIFYKRYNINNGLI